MFFLNLRVCMETYLTHACLTIFLHAQTWVGVHIVQPILGCEWAHRPGPGRRGGRLGFL
jgi:hypothetical protein